MAQPAETFDAYDAVGNREDLSNLIANVDPYDTPGMSLLRTDTARATLTEWQSDGLEAVNGANAEIEGNDTPGQAITPTVRLRNSLQTSTKTKIVSTIQEKVDKAGRSSEMSYQIMKTGKSLKRDMETIIWSNQARDSGSATVARKLRGMEAWYATNVSRGAGGANGTDTTAATDGTQRPFTETLLQDVMQLGYTNGANLKYAMFGPFNRRQMSKITGGATKFYNTQDKKLIATITMYESDFHLLKIIPNRFTRDRTLHLIDPEYAAIAWLEPIGMRDLAITGLTNKKLIWGTYTLKVDTEKAHAVVADLTTS